MHRSEQEQLAHEVAEALNDLDSLPLHLHYVKEFSEDIIRKNMAKALAVPDEDVRKSRGAIFNSLMKNERRKRDRYSRH